MEESSHKSAILKRQSDRIENFVREYEDRILNNLDEDYRRSSSWSERLADKIASFGGSWGFILAFAIFLSLWIAWNTLQFTKHFDDPPFILLNLCLSLLAAFQAPIIMMSQNRHEARDRKATVIDFAIDYKSEAELYDMQGHLHRIEADLKEIKEYLAQIKLENHSEF